MGDLEEALRVNQLGPGRWLAHADPDHESINSMFGGWTAAILLAAVCAAARNDDEPERHPSASTVNFVGPVPPGSDVVIETTHLGGSRSIDHWRAELTNPDTGDVLASSQTVLTARRPTDGHLQPSMPHAPDPDTLDDFHAPGSQGQRTLLRPINMVYGSGDTTSTAWVRELSGRTLDHLQLIYLADQFPPRPFFWGEAPRPSATITMSIYFHARPEEVAAVGSDYILNEAIGSRGESSTSGLHARQWSRNGTLLATAEQLAWYR